MVYPTGSNTPKTVCSTAEDRRRQQQQVDEMSDQIRSGPSMPRNPTRGPLQAASG
jgi:hypothetical protein